MTLLNDVAEAAASTPVRAAVAGSLAMAVVSHDVRAVMDACCAMPSGTLAVQTSAVAVGAGTLAFFLAQRAPILSAVVASGVCAYEAVQWCRRSKMSAPADLEHAEAVPLPKEE